MAGTLGLVPWASHRAVTSTARQGENRRWTLAWVCCPFTSFLTTFHSTKATSCRTLPVYAAADGISGLAIGQTFCELKDGGEGKAHGSFCRLSVTREEGGKVAILEDGAQSVVHNQWC